MIGTTDTVFLPIMTVFLVTQKRISAFLTVAKDIPTVVEDVLTAVIDVLIMVKDIPTMVEDIPTVVEDVLTAVGDVEKMCSTVYYFAALI
jgi:hypothetical protein